MTDEPRASRPATLRPDRAMAAALRPGEPARRRARRRRRDGADRAEEPRLCGHRRDPGAERPLRRGRRRDPLRALLHVAPHLDRPELALAAVAGSAVVVTGRRRRRGAELVAAITLVRASVPLAGAAEAGVDRPVPLEGSRHRLPRRRRRRRRHRRAAEADGHLCRRPDRLGRARVVDPLARRPRLDDGGGRRGGARADPGAAVRGSAGPGRARARGRRACWRRGCSTSARAASRSSETFRAACRLRACPTSTCSRSTTGRRVTAAGACS